jgi:hypothetical protein
MASADVVVIGAGPAASYRGVRAAARRQGNAIHSGERAPAEVLAPTGDRTGNPPSRLSPAVEIVASSITPTTATDERHRA